MSAVKESRLAVRMTANDEHLIRAAAEAQGRTVTDFTVGAAVEAAQQVLADRAVFVLDADGWDEFTRVLDRPVQENPLLERLLTRSSVFDA